MAGDFAAKIDELQALVGQGDLVGSVEIDQVYAKYQHEGLDLRHPEGGKAKYLEDPLMEHGPEYLRGIAGRMLHEGPVRPMIDAMETLSRQASEQTPFEFGDLKASGHPTVTDDGAKVYDRAPGVPRLNDDQLRTKRELRGLGFGNR